MFTMWKIIPMERGQKKKKYNWFSKIWEDEHMAVKCGCVRVFAPAFTCVYLTEALFTGVSAMVLLTLYFKTSIWFDASLFPDFNHNRFLIHMWIKNDTMCCIFSFKTIRKFLYFCSMYWIWWRNCTTILGQKVLYLN